MSRALDVLQIKEQDGKKKKKKKKKKKEQDVLKFLAAGIHLGGTNYDFQMEQTWEKLLLAASAIADIENPADVNSAAATGATPTAGHFTPGAFTNQMQVAFQEPRLLVVTDPRADHQPLQRPLMFSCLSLLKMLTWEVPHICGTIFCEHPWEVMPDLYFYRDPEEIEKDCGTFTPWNITQPLKRIHLNQF
ncbi:hypothetical protein FD755_025327 [Muntiacus reevesi]|uniref:40S ribosomal protein SA C-terminal domain-containing protein n=1 Tax=Muntiacus reevesi TaxID=9886 RepID=A0A5N3UN87_MUNRE|nr:hypothetical protein FD755_025327 [Muntiacus reevesi]